MPSSAAWGGAPGNDAQTMQLATATRRAIEFFNNVDPRITAWPSRRPPTLGGLVPVRNQSADPRMASSLLRMSALLRVRVFWSFRIVLNPAIGHDCRHGDVRQCRNTAARRCQGAAPGREAVRRQARAAGAAS